MQTTQIASSYKEVLSSFLASLETEHYMAQHGTIQKNWKVFETHLEAWAAYKTARGNTTDNTRFLDIGIAASRVARTEKRFNDDQFRHRIHRRMRNIWHKRKIGARPDFSHAYFDAYVLGLCIAAWNDPFNADTRYVIEHWNVWQQGFGLVDMHDGKFYVFRRYATRDM